jgi:hypothetical protein
MWQVRLHPEVEAWFLELCLSEPESADLVAEAIDVLAEYGPALGRPLVDRLQGSRFHHMKERLADERFEEHLANLKEEA